MLFMLVILRYKNCISYNIIMLYKLYWLHYVVYVGSVVFLMLYSLDVIDLALLFCSIISVD